MRIVVVADTHMPRRAQRLPEILLDALRSEQVRCVLHLGDFTGSDVPELFTHIVPLEAVAGNNDGPALQRRFGRKKMVEIDGVRIGMIHGDGSARATAERAWRAFNTEKVKVVLFGHSHVAFCEQRDGIWLVNPGSPTDKRRSPFHSYAILEIKRARVTPKLIFF